MRILVERMRVARLLVALAALSIAIFAQGWLVLDKAPFIGMILYGGAILLYVYGLRQTRVGRLMIEDSSPWPETTISRKRATTLLLVAAGASSLYSLSLFARTPQSNTAWLLYLLSLILLIIAFWVLEGALIARGLRLEALRHRWVELAVLTLIISAGAFVRLYQIEAIPSGLFFDEAINGLDARRVLEEGVYPVYFEANYGRGSLFIYLLALSFKLLSPNPIAMKWVTLLVGTATILVFYFLFCLFFDSNISLVAALLLAFSRWHINFSRVAFEAILLPFFELLTLLFLLRGLGKNGRCTHLMWAGFALGLGLHTYMAFRLFPLVIGAFLLFRLLTDRQAVRNYSIALVLVTMSALLVFAPLGLYAFRNREPFINRARATSIFYHRDEPDLRVALARNTKAHLLMFNYKGDRNPRHNLPGEPMLDPLSGALFVLGFGYSLFRWRQPQYILFLITFAVMLLGGILTVDFEAPQALRSIGVLPAVYFFICAAFDGLWSTCRGSLGRWGQRSLLLVLLLALAYIAYANYDAYFRRQARDFAVWNGFDTTETLVAQEMNALGRGYRYYLSSLYHNHPTLRFLAPWASDYERWESGDHLPIRESEYERVALFLDPWSEGSVYEEAKRYYPEATFKEFSPPYGGPTVLYSVELQGDEIKALQGLLGRYYEGESWEGAPAFERKEDSILFDWQNNPPLPTPFSAQWGGVLYAPEYGPYLLGLKAPGEAELKVDDYLVLEGSGQIDKRVILAEGNHTLEIKAVGGRGLMEFYWQPPEKEEAAVPQWALYLPPVKSEGLLGEYYPNGDWSGQPTLVRIDPAIDFYFHILPLPRPYTVEWRGKIATPLAGTYRFGTQSIDDSHLYIDGRLIMENVERDRYVEGAIFLEAGLHDIALRFRDQSSHSRIWLYWTPPEGEREIIPSFYLLPSPGVTLLLE